jgi:mannose-6-phosphate isomerase-like protein (cupin superfamily)
MYSTDGECGRAPELAARLEALGYADVRTYGEGIEDWVGAVGLHVHPYAETFLLLAGRGRWTRGEETVELEPEGMLVVPPDTPHGLRNVGDVPLLVVSVHERGTLRQTWLGEDPA